MLDGKYVVGPCIGIGGTGVVFEARRLRDGGRFVVKTLRPCFVDHPDLGRRLEREAEVSRSVPHGGIVEVIDQGVLTDGSPYIVMERIRGESLAQILLRDGTIAAPEACVIAVRVLSILHGVHRAGYVHRDVKPEHILLDSEEDGRLAVRLLDFGVCAAPTAPADEKRRENGRVFGTPTYVSPEQAMGNADVDGRADIFGVGVVLYESLVGTVPFRAPTVSKLLLRVIQEDAPSIDAHAALPAGLGPTIMRSLARHADDRWASARAFARALLPYAGDRIEVERKLGERIARRNMLGAPGDAVTTRAA